MKKLKMNQKVGEKKDSSKSNRLLKKVKNLREVEHSKKKNIDELFHNG